MASETWIVLRVDARQDPRRAAACRWARRSAVARRATKRPPFGGPEQAAGLLPDEWVVLDLERRGWRAWAPAARRRAPRRAGPRRRPVAIERYLLTPGYVFAEPAALDDLPPSVLDVLTIGNEAAQIADAELQALRDVCAMAPGAAREQALDALVGGRVRLREGPLVGLSAVVRGVKGGRLVLDSALLGGAPVEVAPEAVTRE